MCNHAESLARHIESNQYKTFRLNKKNFKLNKFAFFTGNLATFPLHIVEDEMAHFFLSRWIKLLFLKKLKLDRRQEKND